MPQEFTLQQIEERLARDPERIDLQIERARHLILLERFDDAKDIYLGILAKNPTQVVALNNLGTLLNIMGNYDAGLKVLREVATLIPNNVRARLNLARSLSDSGELEEARTEYEAALRIEPENAAAHRGLSYVLMYLGDKEAAWAHHRKGTRSNTIPAVPYLGSGALPHVVLLSSPCGGNSPITRLLDKKTFLTSSIFPDFHDPTTPLPPHDLVINAIGDADYCRSSLETVDPLVGLTTKPILNHPDRVRMTGRVDNARLLGTLEGVVTPKIVSLSRETLAGPEGPAALEQHGFSFPVLLRTPGFHGGAHFRRVTCANDLAKEANSLPGQNLLAIQYLDAQSEDGKTRKFRVMMIDGKLYPLHKAVSQNWMIHYYSADMAHTAGHRAEDQAFLDDMPGVLGAPAIDALDRIRVALGLDYAGADFSLNRQGELLLFEANATMAVPEPERPEKWDFRRPAVNRIRSAVREMLLARLAAANGGCSR